MEGFHCTVKSPMVLDESGLNSEKVLLMRPICLENYISVLKQVVLIAKLVLITSDLYCSTVIQLHGREIYDFLSA